MVRLLVKNLCVYLWKTVYNHVGAERLNINYNTVFCLHCIFLFMEHFNIHFLIDSPII